PGVSGLLSLGDAAGPAVQAGGGADEPGGAGEICGPANGGRAFSDDRPTRADLSTLYPTGKRSEDLAGAVGMGIAGATAAADLRARWAGRTGRLRNWLWCRPF